VVIIADLHAAKQQVRQPAGARQSSDEGMCASPTAGSVASAIFRSRGVNELILLF
jgi:hypothetical protein